MKRIIRKIILLSVLVFTVTLAFSQTKSSDTTLLERKVIVKMANGDEFKGTLTNKDENTVILQTDNGVMNLVASNVKSIELDKYKGKFRFSNPHDTRYFFGPTGIPVKKNKGYYQNVLLSSNFVNYGITSNISIGGGLEFISTIAGYPTWFLTPKIGFDISEKSHAAGGILMIGVASRGTSTLAYWVHTFGGSESNVTIGAGYGLNSGQAFKFPAIMIGGTHRVSNGVALLTENYILPSSGSISYFGIHGVRFLTPKNSFDLGAIIIPQISSYIPALPFVGYARIF